MSDYAKLSVQPTYSPNSDYSSPETKPVLADFTLTPDEHDYRRVECDTGGGTTVTLSYFATITLLVVKNTDPTNYVTATWRGAAYNGTTILDNVERIAAGGFLIITDITAANNLTLAANSAAVECQVFVTGT